MPRTYEHLNRYEREVIAQMLKEKYSLSQIGRRLGRSPSTIWREFRRNRVCGRYYPRSANGLAQSRLQLARKPQKVMGASKEQVETLLAKYWSPEQIEGRRKLEGDPSHQSNDDLPLLVQSKRGWLPKIPAWPRKEKTSDSEKPFTYTQPNDD
ncbi:MAG: helix-turn-helix domain-containing protein [Kiritimatiellae bacterium]|nr:helix-turn-helix domain-containing protein [Kiritimatiellia bacterium]